VRLVLAVAAAAVTVGAVAAADAGERIRLAYQAVEGCPDQASFEAAVRSRKAPVLFVDQGQSRTVDVRIEAGPPFAGRLVVRRGDVVEGTRDVHAASCAEVADALTLMVQLAVDPSAALDAPAPSATPAPVTSGSASTSPVEPTAIAPKRIAPQPAPPPPPVVAPTETRPAEAPQAGFRAPLRTLYLGVDIAIAMAVSPQTLVAPSPYFGWRWPGGHGVLEPGFRLAFVYATSGEVEAAGGAAQFTWTVGRVDGCVLSWPPPGPAHVLACARLEAGALTGDGSIVPGALSRTRGWLAAGPLLRAEWAPVGTLFFDADIAPMFHVTDDRFYFAPNATVYTVPVSGLEAAVGLGVHFL
jgi:hypothetical protein